MPESSTPGADLDGAPGTQGPDRGGRLPAIVNVAAGTADATIEALREAGGFDVIECEGDEIAAATRSALAARPRRMVVVGGDGTVGTVAAQLAGTSTELAIIPGGTLNHFARDHGIPVDVEEAIALAHGGSARPADLGRVNGRVFLNTSSVGAYVSLVPIRERLEPRFGYAIASAVAAVRVFFTMHRFGVEISGPDGARMVRTPLLFVGVGQRELKLPALGKRVEGGAPGLHVMVVRGRTRGAVLALAFSAAIRGIHGVRAPHLDAMIVDRIVVRLRTETRVAVDGEILPLESPLEYELLPGALQLVRP